VERKEKERKDELHALQSGEARAGNASEGLALEQLRFLFQDRNKFVRAESGVGGENQRLKTIQEHVKTRIFSAESAEKIRHPREFQSRMSSLRCRAEGLATRPRSGGEGTPFETAWISGKVLVLNMAGERVNRDLIYERQLVDLGRGAT
jgi:hypothetical protein